MNNAWKNGKVSGRAEDDSAWARQVSVPSAKNPMRAMKVRHVYPEHSKMNSQNEGLRSRKESLDTLLLKKSSGKGSPARRAFGLLGGFLVLMLIFTLVSRSAYTLALPQVETVQIVSTSIAHKVSLDGTLEANERVIVPAQANIMIASVYVKNGDKVETDQPLFQYDQASLDERIIQASDAVTKAQLSLDEARRGVEKAEQQKRISIARAQEDCESAGYNGQQSVEQAKSVMEDAEAAYNEKPDNDLYKAYEEAKKAYETAISLADESERAAGRALEDALSAVVTGGSAAEGLSLDLDEAKRALSKLTALKDSSGTVCCSSSGVVTGLSVVVGSEASGSSAMLITDSSQGYRLECAATSEQSKYVEIGDEVAITVSGNAKGFTSVVSGKTESPKQVGSFVISADVPAGYAAGSSTARLQCLKPGARYSDVLPIGAIVSFSESGIKKHSVYILEEEGTVLGVQAIVRRVDVEVLDQNGQYVAVEGAISRDQRVVSSSDTVLQDGSRVREVSS